MRVALDMTSANGQGTGIAVIARQLADALELLPGTEIRRLFPPADLRTTGRVWWDQVGLPAAATACGADVLQVTGFSTPVFRRLPCVSTLHDLAILEHPEEFPSASARLYWGKLLPTSARYANRVTTASQSSQAEILRYLPGLRRAPQVIPWGTPDRGHSPATEATEQRARQRHGLTTPYLLSVATNAPRKDLPTFVRAYRQLVERNQHHGHQLVLAGASGPAEAALRTALQDCPGDVRRLGWVADEDLPGLYRGATLFVHPSQHEGFGLPPLEAMAQGTPVIAAAATSLPEVVGNAGLLFPPGDSLALADTLARLLGDEALRARLVFRGFRREKTFTWERCARAYREIYSAVVGPTPQPPACRLATRDR